MQHSNDDCIQGLSADEFQQQRPYPWVNIRGTLSVEGFSRLRETLPNIADFDERVGLQRSYGQGNHDRSLLHYRLGMKLPEPWLEFIDELQGEAYLSFLRRMFGVSPAKKLILTFEWYYSWQGCGVGPHCDARCKVGTHLFYFNTEEEWNAAWGGDILVLDDHGRMKRHSGPKFGQLDVAASSPTRGNGSFFFQRTAHSWHGVRPLTAPAGRVRKLFNITVNEPTLQVWWRRVRGKDPDGFPLRRR